MENTRGTLFNHTRPFLLLCGNQAAGRETLVGSRGRLKCLGAETFFPGPTMQKLLPLNRKNRTDFLIWP